MTTRNIAVRASAPFATAESAADAAEQLARR